jgi:hypothetical protein
MTYVAEFITMFFGFFVITGIIGGLFRGCRRQILHIASTAFWVGGTFYATDFIFNNYIKGTTAQTLADFLLEYQIATEAVNELLSTIGDYEWIMNLTIDVLLIPVIFVVCWILMWIVARILYKILCSVFGLNRCKKCFFKTIMGGIFGALEGFLFAAFLMLPLVGLTTIATESVEPIREKNTDGQYTEIIEFYDEYVSPVADHEILRFVAENGGQDILDYTAIIKFEGKDINLYDETSGIVSMCLEATALDGVNFAAPSLENQLLLRSLVDDIGESRFTSYLVSKIFSGAGMILDGGFSFFEVPAPFDTVVYSIIDIFATSDADNIHGDLVTILDVYFLLSDSGAIESYGTEGAEEEMKEALVERDEDGKTLVSKVVEILSKNERTSKLIDTLTEMTLVLMAGELGGEDFNAQEAYDDIKTGLNSVLEINPESYETQEAYETARDEEINNALTEHNIVLDADTINQIGDYIDENLGDKDQLTDADLNDILLHYYEIYADSLMNGVTE